MDIHKQKYGHDKHAYKSTPRQLIIEKVHSKIEIKFIKQIFFLGCYKYKPSLCSGSCDDFHANKQL